MSDFKYRLALWLDDHRMPSAFAVWLGFIAFVLLLGLIVHRADAATVSGTITHATKYEDGTDLGTNYKQARVEVGTCVGTAFGTKEGEANVAAGVTAWSVVVPRAFGDFCARALSETVSGITSIYTAAVKVTKVEPKPRPPLLTVATVAYEVLPHLIEGTRLGRNVGTVPLDTACGMDAVVRNIGGTYHEVPREAVKFTKTPKSAVVVARCEIAG